MDVIINIINWFKDNWLNIGQIYLQIIGAASIIVAITPTTADDEILEKIKAFVAKYLALNG